MLKFHNPYNVLSEVISFENVQQMGEMIALKTLRNRYAYARQTLEWLYVGYVKDLNRSNDSRHVFSDAYIPYTLDLYRHFTIYERLRISR